MDAVRALHPFRGGRCRRRGALGAEASRGPRAGGSLLRERRRTGPAHRSRRPGEAPRGGRTDDRGPGGIARGPEERAASRPRPCRRDRWGGSGTGCRARPGPGGGNPFRALAGRCRPRARGARFARRRAKPRGPRSRPRTRPPGHRRVREARAPAPRRTQGRRGCRGSEGHARGAADPGDAAAGPRRAGWGAAACPRVRRPRGPAGRRQPRLP